MVQDGRVRALRANNFSWREIGRVLGIGKGAAYHAFGRALAEPIDTSRTVVKRAAYNGGCSTTSGMMAISMPRIAALHGPAMSGAAA